MLIVIIPGDVSAETELDKTLSNELSTETWCTSLIPVNILIKIIYFDLIGYYLTFVIDNPVVIWL